MVAKSKAVPKMSAKFKMAAKKTIATKKAPLKKIRIGIIVGKSFDPVKVGTEPPNFPVNKLSLTDDEWGKYSVDACTALRMQELHPDLLEIDIIRGAKDMSQKRLQKNHVNVNFWYGVAMAMGDGKKKHAEEVAKCHRNPDCRLDPSLEFYDWVENKSRYMEKMIKAGIPMIPTVIYKDGFDPKQCMKDVQKKGWDKFFCKVGQNALFGQGAIHGKTEDFLGERSQDLEEFAKETSKSKVFLLQPYMLKPNGEVFDEVRNFYIDGEWRYSVFTHGTDESDAGTYEEPEGPRKLACKELADRAFAEIMKKGEFQGKRQTPLLNRVDIGIIPKKGGISLHKADNAYFVNEVELTICTWLDRYTRISLQDVVAQATVKHSLELLAILLNKNQRLPDKEHVRKAVRILNARLGPFKHIKV